MAPLLSLFWQSDPNDNSPKKLRVSAAMLSIDGLVSGLNTESIISGLMSLHQTQVDRLNLRKSEVQVRQQAMQSLEARLLGLRSTMSALNRSINNVFTARTVSSSQADLVTATASEKAVQGSYNLRVISRATAHQVASTGMSSSTSQITTGTISIQLGNRPATSITVDETNNSLLGLSKAINAQSADVTASIIHDQANNVDRLLLTSRHAGASNQIIIDNQLAASGGSAVRPEFTGPAVQDAANAVVQLGSGLGALTAEYESNSISGLIEGVTLDLHGVDANKDVVISVSHDPSKATEAIQEFVEEFNAVMAYIDEQTRFDTATQVAGPLLGNYNITLLKNQLLKEVTTSVPGLGSELNRLSQMGITVDSKGRLSVNSSKLNSALRGELEGVTSQSVARLFGMTASSTNLGIEFVLGSSRTKASQTPYQVDILQAAEQAVLLAPNSLADTIEITSANNQFNISVDGLQSDTLTLTAGSYTREELAAHLQSVINAAPKLGNRDVLISVESNALKITSQSYGTNSKIDSLSGTALADLGFTGSESAVGKDVAGSFIVNGKVETATGSGRVLIGNSDNENTADLQVRVALDPTQVGGGVEAEMQVTRGATSLLDQMLGGFLDSEHGDFATAKSTYDSQLESLNQSIERINAISDAKREYLIKQFAALERALSALQTTSAVVGSQLVNLKLG